MKKPTTILSSLSLIMAFFIASADARCPELVIQTGHSFNISDQNAMLGSVAYSPDGRSIASLDHNGVIKLWDVRTGKEFRTPGKHPGGRMLTFSPDGRILASCDHPLFLGGDGKITLWNVYTDEEYHTLGGSSGASTIAFSPDGHLLAYRSGFSDCSASIILCDRTGLGIFKFNVHPVMGSIAFSPNGEMLAGSISTDSRNLCEGYMEEPPENEIKLWDVRTGRELRAFPGAGFIAFSPDSTILAIGSGNTITLRDVRTGEVLRTLTGHSGSVTSTAFSPDGLMLASGSSWYENCVKLWDVHTGKELRTLPGHSRGPGINRPLVKSVAFSPDGQILISGGSDNLINLWDVHTGRKIRSLKGYALGVASVIFSPEGNIVTLHSPPLCWDCNPRSAVYKDNTIKLWDIRTGTTLHTLTGHSWFVSSVALSQDGKRLAVGGWSQAGDNGIIELWDIHTRTKLHEFTSRFRFKRSLALALSPDGTMLANGTSVKFEEKASIELWNTHTGKPLPTLALSRNTIEALAFSPDGRLLASSDASYFAFTPLGTLTLWDVHTGKALRTLQGHRMAVFSLVFSPNGKILASCSSDMITLWNVRTGQALRSIRAQSLNTSVAFSPDGALLAGGSDDEDIITLWDVRTGAELRTFTGHTDEVLSVSFSPDGNRLVSGSLDGSFKLWDVRSGRELASYVAIEPEDYVVATPDGYYTASKGGLQGVAFRIGDQVFPFEQFDLKFNRPDIVLERIGYASQEVIDAYRRAYEKRLQKMNFNEEMLGDDFHLPETKLLDDDLPLFTKEKHLTFTVNATDSTYLLDRLNVFVNDVPVYGMNGIDLRGKNTSEQEQAITLELNNGSNKIQVSALNQKGAESLSETFEIEYTGTSAQPELYVVAVGVSEYADAQFNLDYAAKDAADVAVFFQENPHNFGKIHVTQILNANAAKEEILAVKDLLMQSKVDDQVVLFFAGHGLLDEKLDYYFATSDIDFMHPAERGLPYEELEGLLDGIPARKKLLLMDTCHSGEVDKDESMLVAAKDVEEGTVKFRSFRGKVVRFKKKRQVGLQNSFELLRELFADLRRGSGAMVIASASGMEFALESDEWHNGVFTYSLLQGLQGEADADQDHQIRVSELRDYVTQKVQQLTNKHQTPTARRENLEFDFRVY